MAASKTIQVPHLGGIKVGYALSGDTYDASKPTCVLINAMCMTVSLYRPQFEDKKLTDAMNLLAIEPLGHGATSCASEHFTYWDTAIMALQVLDALGIKKFFALGTSQGGWMVVRMALLAPERVCASLKTQKSTSIYGRTVLIKCTPYRATYKALATRIRTLLEYLYIILIRPKYYKFLYYGTLYTSL